VAAWIPERLRTSTFMARSPFLERFPLIAQGESAPGLSLIA
jgi:hypothetical protein